MKRKYFLLTLFVFGFTAGIIAQPVSEDLPQITGCFALINAKVISAPGKPCIGRDDHHAGWSDHRYRTPRKNSFGCLSDSSG
ncbi:MAG: hypothetical protein IPP15_12740 [Saprospiraceae bacterium]|uniref:Secreted protein n=1 Tax=Candidatus Opimibacter skivensis TaxID=2982028 RepID=A0A9D7SVY8_9BACT|nr:hypothetical protein [Candidatus Opimibacter skivensis]